ncbi:hypothetical protein FIBSPDRAFT_969732 [Athelia psychrophila]|uniref:Uncharacterized protein n=1 Tax=Athelia psychrophila TaxID=1759441 RepID=A0A167T880_9AGAM|nr:hypothetical protein FIBSPDRAFT_969732 [Fibularhizoctonia sp. CBS 109695]
MFLPTHSKLLRRTLPPSTWFGYLSRSTGHDVAALFVSFDTVNTPSAETIDTKAPSQPPHPTELPLTVKEPAPDPQRSLPQLIPSKFQCPATIGQTLVLNFIAAQVHSASPFSANPPD